MAHHLPTVGAIAIERRRNVVHRCLAGRQVGEERWPGGIGGHASGGWSTASDG